VKEWVGGCLCEYIAYQAQGEPNFPHLCSCTICRKWSGAITVAWVEFPNQDFSWVGPGGKPNFYRSSEKVERGFCPKCGSALCAIDDGSDQIGITIASLNTPDLIIPTSHHSFKKSAPAWWHVTIIRDIKERALP
jgi:hypothetical protein